MSASAAPGVKIDLNDECTSCPPGILVPPFLCPRAGQAVSAPLLARDGCPGGSVQRFSETVKTGQARTPTMTIDISLEDLIRELDKIQANQIALRDAISHDKAIVIHPNWDLLDVEEEKPKPVPKYVVSGGLTGFPCANDLMYIDFSPPAEAPEEFRAVPYNSSKVTTLKSGVSGAFGKVDPGGGGVLSDYLKQLEAQQAMVREMIANQKMLLKSGKAELAGKLQPAKGKMGSGGLQAMLETQRNLLSA